MPIQNVCVDIVNELIHLEITLLHKKQQPNSESINHLYISIH